MGSTLLIAMRVSNIRSTFDRVLGLEKRVSVVFLGYSSNDRDYIKNYYFLSIVSAKAVARFLSTYPLSATIHRTPFSIGPVFLGIQDLPLAEVNLF